MVEIKNSVTSGNMVAEKRIRIYHPFLLALYPVLFIYLRNWDQISIGLVPAPLLLSLAGAVGLYIVSRVLLRTPAKAALFTTFVIGAFYSYGHVESWLSGMILEAELGKGGASKALSFFKDHRHAFLSWVFGIVLLTAGSRLSRSQRPLIDTNRILNSVSAVLVLLPFVSAAFTLLQAPESRAKEAPAVQEKPIALKGVQVSVLGYNPDIYYIILDGYARADVLKKHYAFDNSDFIESLQERGFTVASKSAANYYWTYLSLASSLNMKHITFLREHYGKDSKAREYPYRMIRNNAAAVFLKARGYEFVHLTSTWGATLHNPYADTVLQCTDGIFQKEFYRVLLETTWLSAIDVNARTNLADCHLGNFENLKQAGSAGRPRFILAHFIPPHHPYIFDAEGNILRDATVSNQFQFQEKLWAKKDGYISQLRFMNRKALETVDAILKHSEQPPIIILKSDHGPQLYDVPRTEKYRARLSNLETFYLPGKPSIIPDDITPVNEFRLIFDHYFEAGFGPVPDHHYVSGYHSPYDFKPFPIQ